MARIISISSLKGGVGKSSVTLGLASAALVRGLNTVVIDLDPHADTSTGLAVNHDGTDIGTMLLSPENHQFLAELSSSGWNEIAVSQAKSDSTPLGSVSVARGSATTTVLETLTLEEALPRLNTLITQATRDLADIILIDCPPTLGRITSAAWAASDQVISVAEPALFSVAGTERTMRAIALFSENTEYSVDSASVVLNKVRANDPEHEYRTEEMSALFGDLLAEQKLPDYPQFQRIVGASYPIHFWPEESAQEFAAYFDELLEGLLGVPLELDAEPETSVNLQPEDHTEFMSASEIEELAEQGSQANSAKSAVNEHKASQDGAVPPAPEKQEPESVQK